MERSSRQYPDDHSDSISSSEESITEAEKEQLLESSSSLLRKKNSRVPPFCYLIALLILVANAILLSILLQVVLARTPESKVQKSWLPPEITRIELFKFHKVYGEPPSDEVKKAWNDLMPTGRGFVHIKNDTALPDVPRFNQSITEQHAMVSVFHQLHCLYMTREAYYNALAGNLDEVNHIHLAHCWDYLRQALMCYSDTTLEWLPAPPDDIGSTGWGYQHTCRNFDAVYSWAVENRFKNSSGIH
ncbi:MAG: hypothetical protein MMC33_007635 [Icmadophila ericetorum]|nr:hypothetical protein [Icmadophila ericetorum]